MSQLDNQISRMEGKTLTEPDTFSARSIEEVGKNLILRHPFPVEILRNITPAGRTDEEQRKRNEQDIFLFEDPENDISASQMNILTEEIGPFQGADEVAWPSPLEKVLYLPGINDTEVFPDLPLYKHSCPELDAMLMGAVPYTTFLDISRGGVAKLMAKAYEYASGAMERNWKAYQKGTLDAKTKAFIDKFGVIGCIPITDRPAIFDYANKNGYEISVVGGSSIAEAYRSICKFLINKDLKAQVTELSHSGGWVTATDRQGTDRINGKFRDFMHDLPERRQILFMLESETTLPELQLLLDERYPGHPTPHAQLVADLMMQMVQEQTVLPRDKYERESQWRSRVYGHKPGTKVDITRRDVSEIVVSPEFGAKKEKLKSLPWKTFVLFPHESKETGKILANMDQLIEAAKLIKKYYPDATVYIPTYKGEPYAYDIESENLAKHGHHQSSLTATLTAIAHITLSGDIAKHYENQTSTWYNFRRIISAMGKLGRRLQKSNPRTANVPAS